VVRASATLAAALDVPADATEIDLSVALLSEGEIDTLYSEDRAEISLLKVGGERIEIFDAADIVGQLQQCTTCTQYRTFVAPFRRTADLTSLRGERVFLIAEVDATSFFDPIGLAVLLDDIQIR
jgi:hypothetical protein